MTIFKNFITSKLAIINAALVVLILATVIYNYNSLSSDYRAGQDKHGAHLKQTQINLLAEHDRRIAARSSNPSSYGINARDFQINSNKLVYSDEIFSSPGLPVRLVVDCDSEAEEVLTDAAELADAFYLYREDILKSLQNEITKSFRAHQDNSYTDEKILKFVKQTKLFIDSADSLSATVPMPWKSHHQLILEFDSFGQMTRSEEIELNTD